MALFAEEQIGNFARLVAQDSFIATGPAYAATMPSKDSIVEAARDLMKRGKK
jgi:2-oxoisovalerate dehydrogenase E1 component